MKIIKPTKIPCSVGIITRNNQETLAKTLESVKDFAEIIICDGNSTDNTRLIAKSYGCRIIPQYASAKPNIPIKNKSVVRNKTIQASSFDWYFYIDSDDVITQEMVEHIRKIVNQKTQDTVIWKAKCKIKVNEKVYKYSASYPDHRVVLIHKKTRAKFFKPEHEVIKFDHERYTSGLLHGEMHLCWDNYRLGKGYWKKARIWLERDASLTRYSTLKEFMTWAIWFNFSCAGMYVLKPWKAYVRHGFEDAIPYRIELYRALYHLLLLFRQSQYFISRFI